MKSKQRKLKRTAARAATASLPPEAYDRTPRLQLTLTDETIWLTRFHNGQPGVTYPVTPGDVARAFNVFGVSTGLLSGDLLYWQQRGKNISIALWLPPSIRTLTFAGSKRPVALRVPLPGLVFAGEGTEYRIFAALERPTRPGDLLYHAPLPNVYDSGIICQGSVPFPRCTPETMPAAVQAFFESDFSLHLTEGRVQYRGPLLSFLRSLRGKKNFPNERLLPSGLTTGQLLNDGTANRRNRTVLHAQGPVVLDPNQPAPDVNLLLGRELVLADDQDTPIYLGRTDTILDADEEEVELAA